MTKQKPVQKEEQKEVGDFLPFFQAHISKAHYEELPELLDVSKRKFKRLEANPKEWTGELVGKLIPCLRGRYRTFFALVEYWNFAHDGMTLGEYQTLVKKADDYYTRYPIDTQEEEENWQDDLPF